MNRLALVAIVAAVTAGGVIGFLVWNGSSDAPDVNAAKMEAVEKDDGQSTVDVETDPAKLADSKMGKLESADERIDHLEWVSKQEWAKSDLPVLRKTIVSDPDEAVQIKAVETALTLAQGESTAATSDVVRTSLASTKGNTRARGLKAARENPDANLVDEMIELVDNRDEYATMALNALAHTNSEEAHAKILAVAEDENAEPKLRQRAVALLAVTKDGEAYGLLADLVNSEDETLRRVAEEVLLVLQKG